MAKNILICDDAAFMRMMIKDILTKNGVEHVFHLGFCDILARLVGNILQGGIPQQTANGIHVISPLSKLFSKR